MSNYLISISDVKGTLEKETIHDPTSKLKVKVFDLLESTFNARKGEVQYFVTAGEQQYAFETEGYQKHRQLLILHMIARYCMYSGMAEAEIHSTPPVTEKNKFQNWPITTQYAPDHVAYRSYP